ncbi:Mitochondrial carrier domain [Pseudocohnilembus persalinus]|uniref:Mitochondrial carrier domain n=1 Tax=Pseudocohnilembus persalinus TaxID=266149 RepID=A0A0V0QDH7_PSEPJ|nr:Mitochondrial carrier domain [Pseudocohnilembus persalinus]|eukprot:KRX00255.1 Mitochondrial carrier domain [Pseudocohnilembus persalinus]
MQTYQNKKSLSMPEIISISPTWLLGILGGLGSSSGEIVTFAFDNMKTRMQMNGKQGLPSYTGLLDCVKKTLKSDGLKGFYRGVSPAIYRQLVYSSTRVTLYELIKRKCLSQEQSEKFIYKFVSGGVAGAIGCVVGTPFDVLKIRMINDFQKVKYRGIVDTTQKVLKQEGASAFMKGLNVNIVRAIFINAAELSGYDTCKGILIEKFNFDQANLLTHFISSTFAGAFGAFCASPADVVKTRYMNQNKFSDNAYKSAVDCFVKIVQQEGVGALYKGFLSFFLRVAPWNIIMWMSFEQYKKIVLPRYNGVQIKE